MKIRLLAIICLIACFAPANAQRRLHFDLDYHYFLGLTHRMLGMTLNRGDFDMDAHSARFAVRYDISQRVSAGVGIGIDAYESYNAAPVYATCRYRFLDKQPLYAFTNLGYSIGGSGAGGPFRRGAMFDVGVGYPLMLTKNFGFNFQIGYNLSHCSNFDYSYTVAMPDYVMIGYDTTKSIRHSLSFGVGIVF